MAFLCGYARMMKESHYDNSVNLSDFHRRCRSADRRSARTIANFMSPTKMAFLNESMSCLLSACSSRQERRRTMKRWMDGAFYREGSDMYVYWQKASHKDRAKVLEWFVGQGGRRPDWVR